MRCYICNAALTVHEYTKRDKHGNYKDTCFRCSGVIHDTLHEMDQIPYGAYVPVTKIQLDDDTH